MYSDFLFNYPDLVKVHWNLIRICHFWSRVSRTKVMFSELQEILDKCRESAFVAENYIKKCERNLMLENNSKYGLERRAACKMTLPLELQTPQRNSPEAYIPAPAFFAESIIFVPDPVSASYSARGFSRRARTSGSSPKPWVDEFLTNSLLNFSASSKFQICLEKVSRYLGRYCKIPGNFEEISMNLCNYLRISLKFKGK